MKKKLRFFKNKLDLLISENITNKVKFDKKIEKDPNRDLLTSII